MSLSIIIAGLTTGALLGIFGSGGSIITLPGITGSGLALLHPDSKDGKELMP